MSLHAPDLISELLSGMRLSGVNYRRIEASAPFGLAFGNVAGSCMANLLLILGMSAVITRLPLARHTQRFEVLCRCLRAGCGLQHAGGQLLEPGFELLGGHR